MQVGDKVKVVLDDEQTPDTERFHGREAKIIDIEFDDASSVTGDGEDNFMVEIEFEDGEKPEIHFRGRDLKIMESRSLQDTD
jgi:hypothetical protein